MEWFFYTSFTSRPLSEAIGISGVKGAKWTFFMSYGDLQKGDQWHSRVHTHSLKHTRARLTQSVWFIARPLGRQSWAVDSVTAEQERKNFMDVDIEQQTLTERARITGNQPWPLWRGKEKGMAKDGSPSLFARRNAAVQSWADLETVKLVQDFLINDQCVLDLNIKYS